MAGGYSPITGVGTLVFASASSGGTGAAIPLEPTARTTTILVQGTSQLTSTSTQGALVAFQIQATLDTWVPGGVTQNWQNVSSQVYSLGSTSSTVFTVTSTTAAGSEGVFLTFSGPLAGLRLFSSASLPTAGTITYKTLQSVTAGP
jgi:hypothetical protein